MFEDNLLTRLKYLEGVISFCEDKINKCHESGKIRVSSKGNTPYFYRYHDSSNTQGRYVRKNEIETVRSLVNKEYYEDVLRDCLEEKRHIEVYLSTHSPTKIIDDYQKLNYARKELISPIEVDEETFVRQWIEANTEVRELSEYDYPYSSDKDEMVRSKSEMTIANKLIRWGVPYAYEFPLKMYDGTIFRPDFKILRVKTRETIYLEHCGMMLKPDYVQDFFYRQTKYIKSGIIPGKNLFYTFESDENKLNIKNVEAILRAAIWPDTDFTTNSK